MTTKEYGNIGEAVALQEFVKRGIPVYLPFGENERADMIADFGGKLNKIQVKTSVGAEGGVIKFDLTACFSNKNVNYRHKYTSDEIDYFFCYNIKRDKSFLIKVPSEPISTIYIRYELPKNGQTKNIKFEKDYEFQTVIDELTK